MTAAASAPAPGVVPARANDERADPEHAWPRDDVAACPDLGRRFTPNARCGFCGSWLLREPWAGRCPACIRLAIPWQTDGRPLIGWPTVAPHRLPGG
eukprot:260660-Pyramimonas_sp.AAC.1